MATAFIHHLDNPSKPHFGSVYLPPSPQTALDIMQTPGQVEMTPQSCSPKHKTLALNQNCMTGWEATLKAAHGKALELYVVQSGMLFFTGCIPRSYTQSLHQNTERYPAPVLLGPKAVTAGDTPLTVHHLHVYEKLMCLIKKKN